MGLECPLEYRLAEPNDILQSTRTSNSSNGTIVKKCKQYRCATKEAVSKSVGTDSVDVQKIQW